MIFCPVDESQSLMVIVVEGCLFGLGIVKCECFLTSKGLSIGVAMARPTMTSMSLTACMLKKEEGARFRSLTRDPGIRIQDTGTPLCGI